MSVYTTLSPRTKMKSIITGTTHTWTKGDKLGDGTYGTVHEYSLGETPAGYSLSDGKKVVVKMSIDEDHVDSLIREISALTHLSHIEGVVKIIDVVTENGMLGFVYEKATCDLWTYLLQAEPHLREMDKKKLAYQIALAVWQVQSSGVLNGDYKPQNVLMYPRGAGKCPRPVLADFGLAHLHHRRGPSENFTIYWRAPELLLGGVYSFPADVWAIGIMFLHIFTGSNPFPGTSEIEQLYRYFKEFGTPSEEVWPGITRLPEFKETWPALPVPRNTVATTKLGQLLGSPIYDLIKSMLVYDPAARLSMETVLGSPYFDDVRELFSATETSAPSRISTLPFIPPSEERNTAIKRWIIEISQDLRLTEEVLALTISIFERSRFKLNHTAMSLKLYACASMYLAVCITFDDTDLYDLVKVSCGILTETKIRDAAYEVFQSISFDTFSLTSYDILSQRSLSLEESRKAKTMLQLSYHSSVCCSMSPEEIATKCIAMTSLDSTTRSTTQFKHQVGQAISTASPYMLRTNLAKCIDLDALVKRLAIAS